MLNNKINNNTIIVPSIDETKPSRDVVSNIVSTLDKTQAHPFHLVDPSPWPILISFSLFGLTFNTIMLTHGYSIDTYMIFLNMLTTGYILGLWCRDIISEATLLGHHTQAVRNGIFIGYMLFILTEALFFFGIFWSYFHAALSPNIELGSVWPPVGIEAVNPLELPLLNTIILLSSGATITYSHHALVGRNRRDAVVGLFLTLVLAITFIFFQYLEYINVSFTISDGVFGSTFFLGTGTHGVHIIVGSIMLTVMFIRMINYHFTDKHHLGYETTILYWHFLDIVWLVLFVVFYWWGS